MPIEIFDNVEQGSDEWRRLRAGIPTASVFSEIMAKAQKEGAGLRVTLLNRLAGERITEEPAEEYENGYMRRGKELEAEARNLYALHHDHPIRRVGFVRNGRMGASPDAVCGRQFEDGTYEGGCEIKTLKHELMVALLDKNDPRPPSKHLRQVYGSMLVCGARWWDLCLYSHKKLPPRYFRIERDPVYIADLRKHIDRFNADLDALVERIESYG